jgi:hypothetical protein
MSIKLSGGSRDVIVSKKVKTFNIENSGTRGVKPGESVTVYQFAHKDYQHGKTVYVDGEMYYVFGKDITIVKESSFSAELKHLLNEMKKRNDIHTAEYLKKAGKPFMHALY